MSRLPILLAVAALTAATPAQQVLDLESDILRCRDGSEIRVEEGRIEVPENRTRESRLISLAFVRVPSPLAKPGPPVFVITGGPGGSSIRQVIGQLRGGGRRYLDLLGGDVVGIDQRGVGASRPNLESDTLFGISETEPGDEAKMLALIHERCREEAARWREKGVDLSGYNTAESADDIDALRRALGYEKIALWGGSYGSHLAMATIRRHEKHVARALLTGPEGPDHTIKRPVYAQDGLDRIASLVAANPELAEEIPDLVAMVKAVLARLEKKPVWVEIDGRRVGISKFDVQRWLANELGHLYGHIERVPSLVKAMADDDFEDVAREIVTWRREAGVGSAMQMVMDAASGVSPARAAQIAKERGECLLGDAVNFATAGMAEAWGIPVLGEDFRGPLKSEVPILFVVGDLDSRTPVGNALELRKHLPNAHLIVVENQAHDLKMGHPELLAAWRAFLRGEEVTVTQIAAPKPRFRPIR